MSGVRRIYRYQAQVARAYGYNGVLMGCFRVLDLRRQVLAPMGDMCDTFPGVVWDEFDPVPWFAAHGWLIGVPWEVWRSDGTGVRFTHQVRPAAGTLVYEADGLGFRPIPYPEEE